MDRLRVIALFIAVLAFCGCSKEEDNGGGSGGSLGSGSGNGATSSCSTISAQTTITHNGINYKINALSGSNNSIGIEIINLNGPFTSSYSMQLLQVSIGSSCYESTSSTEGLPGLGKFFEFKNMPAWSISTSTTAKIRIILDGNTYYIKDLNLDQ